MLNKKKVFFNNLIGEWILTKNIYLINKKKVYLYKESVKIINQIISQKYNEYSITNNKLFSKEDNFIKIDANNIIKKSNVRTDNYLTQYINREQLTIKFEHQNIRYEENIYSINNNLKISIGIFFKNDKYKYIIFCSYIKKI